MSDSHLSLPVRRACCTKMSTCWWSNKPAGLNTHAPESVRGRGHLRLAAASRAALGEPGDHSSARQGNQRRDGLRQDAARQSLAYRTIHAARRPKKISPAHGPAVATKQRWSSESQILRAGERYVSAARGEPAETRFKFVGRERDRFVVEAEPMTGRTHQIRVHAADHGFPILGDTLYGGAPAARVYLHAGSDVPTSGNR